jgi:N-acyl-phosphatidylethanolamine-hydrolysing phospholipase D
MKNQLFLHLALLGILAIPGCSADSNQGPSMQTPRPPHHNADGTFKNMGANFEDRGMGDVIKWWWQRETPEPIQFEIVPPNLSPWLQKDSLGIHALWIGHSTFLIRMHGLTILTDPVFSKRASPVQWAGPKRSTPVALQLEQLPPIDVVILSHDHYDHTDLNSLRGIAKLKSSTGQKPVFLSPLGFKKWFAKNDLPETIEKNWWDSAQVSQVRFTATPVQHWGKRGIGDNNSRLWCGWMIESQGKKIFFNGDTGYSTDFVQTFERFGPVDLALIPIGAYDPEWFMKPQHVNPEEAVQIHQDLRAKQSIGMHWGTFQLTDEPMDEPPYRLIQALQHKGLPVESFIAMYHGGLWSEGGPTPKYHLGKKRTNP